MIARAAAERWTRWHRRLAWTAGLWLLAMAGSGLLMAWQPAITAPGGPVQAVPSLQAIQNTLDALPAGERPALRWIRPASGVLQLHWSGGQNSGHVRVHAGTGQTLPETALDAALATVVALHAELLLGEVGAALVLALGLASLGLLALGLMRAWPARAHWGGALWPPMRRRPPLARRYGLHRALGLWCALPLGLTVITGVLLVATTWGLGDEDADTSTSAPLRATTPPANAAQVTTLWSAALALHPGHRVVVLDWPADNTGPVTVELRAQSGLAAGSNRIWTLPAAVPTTVPAPAAGADIVGLAFGWHAGLWFGSAAAWVTSALVLGAGSLGLFGFALWSIRSRRAKAAR